MDKSTSVDNPTHLYLIRHGESVPNVRPIMGGMRGDAGLTALGVSQAQRLRDRLASTGEITADALISSTLPRARETAEIIAPALGLPIQFVDEVQEMRPGDADGMNSDEAREKFGWNLPWDVHRPLGPGGESWSSFLLRVHSVLHNISQAYAGKTVVVVCHGGVIDGSLLCLSGVSPLILPPIRFDTINTSITYWQRHPAADSARPWRLMRYNDSTHLNDLRGRPIYGHAQGEQSAVPLPTEG